MMTGSSQPLSGADPAVLPKYLGISTSKGRVAALYLLMVVGVMAHWFWSAGWGYLGDPAGGLQLGSGLMILVRFLLALIASALTFVPTYNKISKPDGLDWVPYFLAFQNGFFWEAALETVVSQF